jgi:hypothetical protein
MPTTMRLSSHTRSRVALDFALDHGTQDWRDFPERLREGIEDGMAAWERLKRDAGFDLRGVFRRRELAPLC